MPNVHAADKEMLGLYMPRALAYRVRKAAKKKGIPITQYINLALTHATHDTELTSEDYQEIAAAVRAAECKASERACKKAADRRKAKSSLR